MNPFVNEPTESEKKEYCILCGSSWWSHEGWLCPTNGEPYRMQYLDDRYDIKKIPRELRFWTESMRSLAAKSQYNQLKAHIHHDVKKSPVIAVVESIPDWKKFQHLAPGECPCGISRSACEYHR